MAGPGMAVITYLLMGTLMWYVPFKSPILSLFQRQDVYTNSVLITQRSVNASLAEMTALFPVKGPNFEFARRFIDEAVGMASAWMLWYVATVVGSFLPPPLPPSPPGALRATRLIRVVKQVCLGHCVCCRASGHYANI